MRKLNKVTATIAGGALLVATAGVAYAYWTTSGSGNGSATTAAPTGVLTVEQTNGTDKTGAAQALTPMFPGDVEQTVSGLITNPNAETYSIDSVTVKIASVTKQDGSALPGCDLTDYELGGAPATSAGVTLDSVAGQLAKDASKAFSTTLQFHNKTVAQDACKGAKVNLSFATNAS